MRSLGAALFLLLAAPGIARAGEATLVARDLPVGHARSLAASSPALFDLVGLHWQGPGRVRFRTSKQAGGWSVWRAAAPEPEDGPNTGSAESTREVGWQIGSPYWTGLSDRIEYRLSGRVTRLRAYFVRSPVGQAPSRTTSIVGSPAIVTRAQWNANEKIRRAAPFYAPEVRFAVVHHTAGTTDYTPAESAAIVRGIEVYHVQGNGWNDIGYTFLVDKYGQVFEGRYGGVDRNVVGAHAEGFNVGSFGVALIGSYGSAPIPAAARASLVKLLAWRLDVAHVDPRSRLTYVSGGNPRYPAGREVTLRAISGHRDTGPTSCPGNALYAQLPGITETVAATGLPKLYAPRVSGTVGAPVQITATLSAPLPWTVAVTDGLGRTVASGAGRGTAVNWTWDATSVAPGRYTYAIRAGPSVRPAIATVGAGAAVVLPLLSNAHADPATLVPTTTAGSGATTVTYRLAVSATVSATLVDPLGAPLGTLLPAQLESGGDQSLVFDASALADGTYGIQLAARSADGKQVQKLVTLRVDRESVDFTATPKLFSPNADGRFDTATLNYSLPWAGTATLQLDRGFTPLATLFSGTLAAGPQQLVWDGLAAGRAADGSYRALLTLTNGSATIVHATPLTIDTTPPRLRLLSRRPLRLRLSETARLQLLVNGRRSARTARAGVVAVAVRGRLRTLRAVARDAAGNAGIPLRLR